MLVLGIETSCDETGAAVVASDGRVVSDVVQSQVKAHAPYGGVVPELASRAKGYIRVAERRWDVRFENGVTVKLPEAGEDQALASLASLDRESGLLSRDILSVDMRFADRLVVQLTPEAATQRAATVKELLKPRPKGKVEKKA